MNEIDMARFTQHLTTADIALEASELVTAGREYAAALSIDRSHPSANANMAVVLLKTNRLAAAEILAYRAVRLQPTNPGVYTNLGYILGCNGKFAECERMLSQSLDLGPSHFAWHSLGLCLFQQGRFEESVAAFDAALRIKPGDEDSIDKRAISLLGEGNYIDGLKDNRIRWNVLKAHPLMHSGIREWNGESLQGRTIMVLHEQGFGDTFQFCRFIPWLKTKRRASRVILSVPRSTIELFQTSGIADEVIPLDGSPMGSLASVDFICPMMTIAAHLGVTIQDVDVAPSYLAAPKHPHYLPVDWTGLRVGLVWGGRPQFQPDMWRSMDVKELFPLLETPGIDFYSLQIEERAKELHLSGAVGLVTDMEPRIKSWSDTASIISELDALVTVDTSVAHLAGAMGKQTLIMIPEAGCWRWLTHDLSSSPWYPSVKLFRQRNQGDWRPVIEDVRMHLEAQVGACNDHVQSV